MTIVETNALAQGAPAYLRSLAEHTAQELWKVARLELNVGRLLLPLYRAGAVRVSEQEARSIAQRLISVGSYWYTIETPTRDTFNFTGQAGSAGRSAQHDLSLYAEARPQDVVAHMEFKQGHRSGDDGIQLIAKDLAKLLASGEHSLWFHSFPKPTRVEFSALRENFLGALERVLPAGKALARPETKVILAFCAVVDPELWIAGPMPWLDLRAAFDQFPVVSKAPHRAWSRIAPAVPEPPPPISIEFPVEAPAEELISLDIEWSAPVTFDRAHELPNAPGVYAILLDDEGGMKLVRIGATRDASKRPANYDRAPFDAEPRLRIVFCPVSDDFRTRLRALLERSYASWLRGKYPDHEWAEYRIERKLLDAYESTRGALPPANFQRGSARDYLHAIAIREVGHLHVLELPPAELDEMVRFGLRQSND